MNGFTIVAGLLCLALIAYLLWALLEPEDFS